MPGNTTTTVTFTATHTTIQQIPAANLFGIPPEALLIVVGGFAAIAYLFFRFQVKSVPVMVLWIFKNASGIYFRAQEDLQGIFLNILNARGKSIETLKKTGIPIEVEVVGGPTRAYFISEKERDGEGLDDEAKTLLQKKGFRITEKTENRKRPHKAYLIDKVIGGKRTAYIDVSGGGLKRMKLYGSVEGTGQTIDWPGLVSDSKGTDTGNSGVIHEELSAAKAYLHLLAEAAKGTFATLLLPLGCGIGIGGMVVVIVMILTGHFK